MYTRIDAKKKTYRWHGEEYVVMLTNVLFHWLHRNFRWRYVSFVAIHPCKILGYYKRPYMSCRQVIYSSVPDTIVHCATELAVSLLTARSYNFSLNAGWTWSSTLGRSWSGTTGIRHLRTQWRHNEHDGVSHHQPRDCLLNRLLRYRLKKTSKLRDTGLCVGNSPVTGEFHTQRASNTENVSIWWRRHDIQKFCSATSTVLCTVT